MKIYSLLFALPLLGSSLQVSAEEIVGVPSAWGMAWRPEATDNFVFFNPYLPGVNLPIMWGFDTAWNSYANMLRGVRYSGSDAVGVARVSFQPWAEITQKGVLPETLRKNLDERMATVGLIGKKVDIVLNLDGGDNTIKEVYGGYRYENPDDPWWSPKEYIGDVKEQGPRWADLIDATAAAVLEHGYRVITASPLNEPDLELNGTPKELFLEIARNLKDHEVYPRFRDIRISGGNTLNNDEAMPWYDYLSEYLDEGNTHQLAGSFDNYVAFFRKVREDGKYATADELHNVMEAMVGVEYGMQTGIWWGSAEQARGEFMKASFGERLGYAENRTAWSAASVYRAPGGKLQGFLGCSERQARPSVFSFVSLDGPVFVNGYGPAREYSVSLPADPDGAYQTELQRNAETVVAIETGTDIRPAINGEYALVNRASHKVLGGRDGSTADGSHICQADYTQAADQLWNVTPVPHNIGGDFSYFFIRNSSTGQAMDNCDWNLNPGGIVIAYGPGNNAVQQWALEYDGDGWFHIRNKHSALYLECVSEAAGTDVVQNERGDSESQQWRLIPAGAPIEFEAPAVPQALTASARNASVCLKWDAVADNGPVTYAVLRAEKGSDRYNTIARGIEETAFVDNSVDSREYSYRVFAEDASGNRSEACAPVSASAAGTGLIAHFPLEKDAADMGPNAFSLYSASALSFRSDALFMRGQQYLQLPYSLCGHDRLTVMMTAMRSTPTDGLVLFSTGCGPEKYLDLSLYDNGTVTLRRMTGQSEETVAGPAVDTRVPAHLAVVLEGETASLYVDGKVYGTIPVSGLELSDRMLSYIGRGQKLSNTYFAGSVSDLKVYNRALSAEEIAAEASGAGVAETDSISRVVKEVEYYTPLGVRISAPASDGITIVRTIYSDGSAKVERRLAGK